MQGRLQRTECLTKGGFQTRDRRNTTKHSHMSRASIKEEFHSFTLSYAWKEESQIWNESNRRNTKLKEYTVMNLCYRRAQ